MVGGRPRKILQQEVISYCLLLVGLWKIVTFLYVSLVSIWIHIFFLIIWGETAFAFVLPVPHLCPHHNQQTSVTKDGKLLPSSPCRWGDTVEQQARDTVVGASSISMWMLKALLLANIFLSSSNNQMKHFAFWALIFQASNFPGPWPPGLIRSVQSCFMPEKNSAVAV